ncbi:MAG TPA: hypothetical protein VFA15_00325 [Nitrososphaera sp.]|nr:hypothetical protein [Nitrososphaera sp.]
MRNETFFNKVSCRACGYPLTVTKICSHCHEPVNWQCGKCMYTDDSVHGHGGVQAIPKVSGIAERDLVLENYAQHLRRICA